MRRYLVILPLLVGLVACGESKVSQCDRLIQPIEQTAIEAKSTLKKAQTPDLSSIQRGLSVTDKAALNLSAIKVDDPKLKEYQTGIVNLYRTNSKATKDFITAYNEKDRTKANAALNKWKKDSFGDREQKLIAAINNYCFSK